MGPHHDGFIENLADPARYPNGTSPCAIPQISDLTRVALHLQGQQ